MENFTYLIPSPPRNSGTPDISKRELADALLIARCRKLWDSYFEKPTKKNLRDVLSHLEEMKSSKNEAVAKERSKCLREANKEAKRLKVK